MFKTFEKSVSSVEEIEYRPEWANGTGYFDKAITADVGKSPIRTVDEHGRKILFIPVESGNIVVFQRFAGKDVLVSNAPSWAFPLFASRLHPLAVYVVEALVDGKTSVSGEWLDSFCCQYMPEDREDVRSKVLDTLERLGLGLA